MSHQEFATEALRSFFERLQSFSAATDVGGLAAMYAGHVMIAGANGARIVSSTDMHRAILKRKQLLGLAGCQHATLVGLEETVLGNRYSLVRAPFEWRFRAANGLADSVTLPSIFVVDRDGDSPHIVFYLNEHDVVSVLRERGALPPIAPETSN